MRIDIADLRAATDRLLTHVEEQHGQFIEINADFYWNIPHEEWVDPYKDPVDLDMGQLTEDWAEIQRVAQGEKEPVSYALVWLAALFRIIGERLVA